MEIPFLFWIELLIKPLIKSNKRQIITLWSGDPSLQRKQRFDASDLLDGVCTSETGIISDGRTGGNTDIRWENNTSPLTCG